MMTAEPLIFDGHNDALLQLWLNGGPSAAPLFGAGYDAAIDVPAAKQGGFAGGMFAIYVPSRDYAGGADDQFDVASYDIPLPAALDQGAASEIAMAQVATLLELERQGHVAICRTTGDIRAAMDQGRMAAVMHMEGAEPIGADLHMLDVLYAAGLRSLGPVWSRPTIFGHGVPFRFPATPDTGPGLTDAGKALVKRCNELRVLIDLSHLNEAGFWDVAKLSDAPLVATHSNAHALCPHARNLTDDQLRAIADSDGMVGLNFAVAFLRDDGQKNPDVPLATMLAHLDHLISILGEDRVGLGSDYDGAAAPRDVTRVSDLPALRQSMTEHGYSDALIAKLCHENWLRVLERTWGE